MDAGFWLYGRWLSVWCMLHFGCLVMWTLDFGCIDVGFWVDGCWILVVWTMYFGCMFVGFWFDGCWILVVWTLDICENVTSNRYQKHNVVKTLYFCRLCRDRNPTKIQR